MCNMMRQGSSCGAFTCVPCQEVIKQLLTLRWWTACDCADLRTKIPHCKVLQYFLWQRSWSQPGQQVSCPRGRSSSVQPCCPFQSRRLHSQAVAADHCGLPLSRSAYSLASMLVSRETFLLLLLMTLDNSTVRHSEEESGFVH